MTAIIVEDEPIIAADLQNQLAKADINVLRIFEDGKSTLEFLKLEVPDVIIMDIQLQGDMDGIEVAENVNRLFQIPIIFLTSNTDKATFQKAKSIMPNAFLSKPFRIKDILNAIELAVDTPKAEESSDEGIEYLDDRVFIKQKDALEKVLFEDILYVEAEGAYTKLYTRDKQYWLTQTLKKTEENLKFKGWVKVHRSYMANLKNVDRISDNHLYIGKSKVPISKSRRENILGQFKKM